MKRSIQRKIKLSATFLLVISLTMTCRAVQEPPLPDRPVDTTLAGVTAEKAPAANGQAQGEEAASKAKLIVLQPKTHPTSSTAKRDKAQENAPPTSRAVLSLVPKTKPSAPPAPLGRSASTGSLKLLPAKSVNQTTSAQPVTKPKQDWTELDIPKHVLYPEKGATNGERSALQVAKLSQATGQFQIIKPKSVGSPTAAPKKDKSIQLQPIQLKSGGDTQKMKPSGIGQLQILKATESTTSPVRSAQVQRSPLQPIQLKSETVALPKKPKLAGQLQVIKRQPDAPVSEPERVNNITLQPIVLQSRTEATTSEMPPTPAEVTSRSSVQIKKTPANVLTLTPSEIVKPKASPNVAQNIAPPTQVAQADAQPAPVLPVVPVEIPKSKVVQTDAIPSQNVTPEVMAKEPSEPAAPVAVAQTEIAPVKTEPTQEMAPKIPQNKVVQAVPLGNSENKVVQAEAEQKLTAPPIVVKPAGVQMNVSDPVVTPPVASLPSNTPAASTEIAQTEIERIDADQKVEPLAEQAVTRQPATTDPIVTLDTDTDEVADTETETPASEQASPVKDATETPAAEIARRETAVESGAVSAAGIPFYPGSTDEPEPPQNPEFPRGEALEKILAQNNGRENWQGSAERISSSNDSSVLNRGLQDPQTAQQKSVVEGKSSDALEQIAPGTGDYFRGANESGTGPIQGCGNPECIGCYGADEAAIARQMECCGSMLCARRYFIFDTLYMNRDDGGVAGSNFFSVSTPYDFGYRATLGWRQDAAEGTELTYWGSQTLSAEVQRFNPSIPMNAAFLFGTAFTGDPLPSQPIGTGFYQVNFQAQHLSTEFQSLEFNRTKWAWDVFKSFYGMRMIYFEDRYLLASQNQGLFGAPRGEFKLDSQNFLFGPQIGSEYFYDVGYKISFSLLTKIGIHANFSEMNTNVAVKDVLFPAPTTNVLLDNVANKTKVAGTLEVGFQTHYQLAPQSRLRLGYNALWMWGVLTAEDNFPAVITPFTGTDPQTNNSGVLIQGINFGLEFYR
ncbi:MAG: BBP7 family outer membrane beta-barrel protein [Planctomycetota bacterium]|nr:BBP7 family outer membrane beta-barrel protein [Planctomycetota bacterium]